MQMDVQEFKYWVAYFSLNDEKYKEKIEKKLSEERTEEENAFAIQQMLLGLKNGIS